MYPWYLQEDGGSAENARVEWKRKEATWTRRNTGHIILLSAKLMNHNVGSIYNNVWYNV